MRHVITVLQKAVTAKDRMIVQKDAIIRQKDATIEYQHATIRRLCLSHQLEDGMCAEAGADLRYSGSTSPLALPAATPATAMNNTMLPFATDAASLTNMWVVNTTAVALRRLLTEVSNWAALKTACGSSGTVALSADFVMGTYTSQIDVSGKHLVIIGNSKTLDAGEKG
jgi:hypothetical protein